MEKQPEWIRSRPHRWEDLRPPPSNVTEEPKNGESEAVANKSEICISRY